MRGPARLLALALALTLALADDGTESPSQPQPPAEPLAELTPPPPPPEPPVDLTPPPSPLRRPPRRLPLGLRKAAAAAPDFGRMMLRRLRLVAYSSEVGESASQKSAKT